MSTSTVAAEPEKRNGGYNEFPPGWREIEEATFARSNFFTYAPERYEHRQMLRTIDGTPSNAPAVSARLCWMHDGTGFAIVNDFWAEKVKFFAFGCEHQSDDPNEELKRRGLRLFSMQHANFCRKCGWLGIYDSSD